MRHRQPTESGSQLATVVPDDDVDDGQTRIVESAPRNRPTRQQRFEDSSFGKVLISGLVAVFVLLGVVANLPTSPISRGLQAVISPIAGAVGLEPGWRMFTVPETRVVSIEVDVKMASGDTRVWHMQPGSAGVGWWARWTGLKYAVIRTPVVRPQLANWVVRQVTKPDEHPTDVTVLLRTENLSKPGEEAAGKSPATKVLYQETLAPK